MSLSEPLNKNDKDSIVKYSELRR